jgi:hypothetical protein
MALGLNVRIQIIFRLKRSFSKVAALNNQNKIPIPTTANLSYQSFYPGLISPTYSHAALTPTDPKSAKNQSSCKYLFALLESWRVKAASKMGVKLTPIEEFVTFCL